MAVPESLNQYMNEPRESAIRYLLAEKKTGRPIIGLYCCFAPKEIVLAAGCMAVGLCATTNTPIEAAERILPSNLCPLIKSSFGFILNGTCPFFEMSDAIIAETTCDGKKKMFELIRGRKPMHVLELTQMPYEQESFEHWEREVAKLKGFIERTFDRTITDEDLERAISICNRRRALQLKVYDFCKDHPPLISASEINRLLDVMVAGSDYDKAFMELIADLETKRRERKPPEGPEPPRVLLTGCPIAGDAAKVIRVIEECGGAIVVHESCSGIKPLVDLVEERTGNPLRAIAQRYFKLPCSCMTPNNRRLDLLDRLIKEFEPDCVIDVILQACHTYNIESHMVKEHVAGKHHLPFLKIETDYSQSDVGRIRVRVEALLEIVQDGKSLA
jgi:benzoyl-CoA reductase/2-hydroxyglutaryl-CoA dehydratase subunit BcrC/BadD/HgdB